MLPKHLHNFMKLAQILALSIGLAVSAGPLNGATIHLFNVNDQALSLTEFYNGQPNIFATNSYSGTYDLGVTGITSGSSSLPNPGRESSGSGSFMADHTFGPLSWELRGWAQGSIDAGLGNTGTTFPTIANTTILSTSLSFFVDTPFTLTLTGIVLSQFTGTGADAGSSGATVGLFAEILDGQIVNDYVARWSTFRGDTGGSYTGSFSSGVFRLDVRSSAYLSSNVPDATLNQYSSYDAQMSIVPVPEPGSALLLTAAAFLPVLRRRRCGNCEL
jgi:hypothetical protein